MIQFKNASLGYGKIPVLEQVNCSIGEADSISIIGQNGSGKTTFLKTILGVVPVLSGSLKIRKNLKFAYVPQVDEFQNYFPLTIRQGVLLALKAKYRFGKISAHEERRAEKAMEHVNILPCANLLIRNASGGQRQRMFLAQALAQDPDIILLDEPTRGLDLIAENDFLNILTMLREEKRVTFLIVTHTLHVALNYSNRIFIIHKKKLTETNAEELSATRKLEEVYGTSFANAAHKNI